MSASSHPKLTAEPSVSEPPLAVSERVPSEPMSRVQVSWPHLILALIGMGIAAWAWYEHGVIARGEETGCSISATISCDEVIGSKYGKIFGLPLGLYGMLYFAIVLVVAFSTSTAANARRSAALQRLAVTTVGVCCSAVFTYISVRIIGILCPICMATHTTTFLLFCASLWQVLKLKRQTQDAGI